MITIDMDAEADAKEFESEVNPAGSDSCESSSRRLSPAMRSPR